MDGGRSTMGDGWGRSSVLDRPPSEAEVVLDRVRKAYETTLAVEDVTLEVRRGELVSLLGPSGCGKTTTLRMVAGFVLPTAGSILLRGRDITRLEPYKRDTAMVFQNYALFPHLTVFENVAFGLKRRRTPSAEIAKRVGDMLRLLELTGFERRYPRQLSGGQQQRVAVARALVINPAVILLDEPLSNLDAKLRASTRVELRRLQQELGLTAIFVTHDQEEAMAISDRIVVMNRGRVEQVGTAREIYRAPATQFVANFIGASNTFSGTVAGLEDGLVILETPLGTLRGARAGAVADRLARGAPANLVIRPEEIRVGGSDAEPPAPGLGSIRGQVAVVSYLGATVDLSVRAADGSLVLARGVDRDLGDFPVGATVSLSWPAATGMVFPG
jgi:spermidine/putrescine ABC transporter ATP-binding subunit